MSDNETVGHIVSNKSVSRIHFPLNMSPPSLCMKDSMSVGKCGDADAPSLECEECQHVCLGDECWHPPMQNNLGSSANPIYTTNSKSEPQDKSLIHMRQRRRSSSYSKSLESVYLNEPPKLRRGHAYMDFEDGDCEPDDCLETCLVHTVPDCGLDEDSIEFAKDTKLDGSIARWRTRMSRVLRQNPFARLTKRDIKDSNEPSKGSSNTTVSDMTHYLSPAVGLGAEHLPSGDLFHQFNLCN